MAENHFEKLFLYESGELSREDAAGFETHLASCAECQNLLKDARQAHGWAELAEEEPSPELFAAALSQRKNGVSAIFGRWAIAAAATAVGIVAMALVLKPAKPTPKWETDLPVRVWTLCQNSQNLFPVAEESRIYWFSAQYQHRSGTQTKNGG
ncbi:MAG: zf-HC2 domain-containing protein [Elusimicrobiales bacterium]|nr:zf-HC2 domain-containing protein [Elusimicrobiales bacterium]